MDRIRMCDMEFHGFTGCLDFEKRDGQTFIVTCDMGLSDLPGKVTDRLEDTVNYAEVYDKVRSIVTTSDGNLIENLAYRIGREVITLNDLIAEVKVTVSKPMAPVEGKFRTMETVITVRRDEEEQT